MFLLPIYVYRNDGADCTNHGLSSEYKLLYLVENESDYGTIPADELKENTVILVHRSLFGDGKDYPVLVPYKLYEDYKKSKLPIMFGGNFAYTSDSRFPSDYPLPIHDRVESWKEYNSYD